MLCLTIMFHNIYMFQKSLLMTININITIVMQCNLLIYLQFSLIVSLSHLERVFVMLIQLKGEN